MPLPAATVKRSFKPLALILAGVVTGALFSELGRPGVALAGEPDKLPPDKVLNSAEQARQMSVQLGQINDRLGRIESTLNGGLKVRVTEMPAKDK